ncbi:MAG: hypothetical protein L0Z50_38645, partial [Verrucomicrobiales bacterium]|nr:hypothetical protein [Verrucomicrobiales bacterium]
MRTHLTFFAAVLAALVGVGLAPAADSEKRPGAAVVDKPTATAGPNADKASDRPAKGPLTVLKANPRYFTDGSGKAVYLTGSHNWDTFQRWFEGREHERAGKAGMPASFTAYLDVL